MAIDPAFDITVNTASGEPEEEEGTADFKVLYDRFNDKVNKNLIQGNRKDQRGNQNAMRGDD